MFYEILGLASREQIISVCEDLYNDLKAVDKDKAKYLAFEVYEHIFGCHFSPYLLDKALKAMINEDGTKGGHWTLAQTNEVARNNNVSFENFNEYDFCYVLNMMYSDYYKAVDDSINSYFKLAMKFLNDKDMPKGKAYKYYMAMNF